MKNLQTTATVLEHLSHNQDALRAAVEELAKWVGERGATEVLGNVQGALTALDDNIGVIHQGIAELVAASFQSE